MNISMQQMLEAGVHFGHQTRYWNPKMNQYIFGIRHKIHIINLDKTLPLFQDALNFIGSIAAKKGKILFVATKHAAQDIVREQAERCGMPYASYRWLGGMLTNYKTIRQSIKRLKELEEIRNSQVFEKLTKKEGLLLEREIVKLEHNLGGIKDMGGLPDALFVIDVGHENIAVSEASKLKIPIVGIVDTNNNPDGIDYLVPGNDDSAKAIRLYATSMADAIIDARGNITDELEVAEKEGKKMVKKVSKQQLGKKILTKKITHAEEIKVETESKDESGQESTADVANKTVKIEKKDVKESAKKRVAAAVTKIKTEEKRKTNNRRSSSKTGEEAKS